MKFFVVAAHLLASTYLLTGCSGGSAPSTSTSTAIPATGTATTTSKTSTPSTSKSISSTTRPTTGRERLRVVNNCQTDAIWIASDGKIPAGPLVKLNPGDTFAYNIADGTSSTRFWPKMYCNSDGQECEIGDSGGPGQVCSDAGCAPPVDSKFEATFGHSAGDCHTNASQCDWWDTSGVDGFTLPYKVDVSDECKVDSYTGTDIDCSKLHLSDCPVEDVQSVGNRDLKLDHPVTGNVVGCYSPCSKLTTTNWKNPDGSHSPEDSIANPYCCPTPPVSSAQCRAGPASTGAYTNLIHASCPHVYAYAYDDSVGLQVCPATTTYTWSLFCPVGSGPAPRPSPMPPSPQPAPQPAPTPGSCNVGDSVACPSGGGVQCAGNQCCPDGSTCPSASPDFSGCQSGKTVDCTGQGADMTI